MWHASAHVWLLDFWSGKPFFKIGCWWRNPPPSTLRLPRKLLYQYSRDVWSILEVLNAIFCIFVQALSRKFEVIEEKCTKPYSLWLVFLQTDQIQLVWSQFRQIFKFRNLHTTKYSYFAPGTLSYFKLTAVVTVIY